MSEQLIASVQELLKEESWTRSTISNFGQNSIAELEKIVDSAFDNKCENEVRDICDKKLAQSKDSITALYISGMITIRQTQIDNSALVTLIEIFKKNKKDGIVENICHTVLARDENNEFALRTLAACYKDTKKEEMWQLYERIVKIDPDEADMAKLLAERAEEGGDIENAVNFYKKALFRYVSNKNMGAIKEMWTKLIALVPEEIDFFLLVQRKVAKSISENKSSLLLQELFTWYKDNKKWETAIDILKLDLQIDKKDSWARRDIVECYRGLYADRANLEDFITKSNLTDNYRDVFEAIGEFEKRIAFDVKNFVFHRSWGVGKIVDVNNEGKMLTINFGKKNGKKEMTLDMAVSALTPLKSDHIWVLKATKKREELAELAKSNKKEMLTRIIKSFNNSCDFKRIKAELVPAILEPREWTSWNNSAKKILETDSTFGVNPNDITQYIVRDHEISYEEKYSNEFKAQKQFFARVDIIMKFINDEKTEKDNDLFSDMFQYFVGFIKTITHATEQNIAAYLVVQKISNTLSEPAYQYQCKYSFADIYKDLEDPRKTYEELKDTKNTSLKSDFLANVRRLPDWQEQYIRLFPSVLKKEMLTALVKEGATERLKKFTAEAFENYRDYRNAVVFLFENCQSEDWYKNSSVSYEKQLITLLNIIEICFREIANHVNTTENKKIAKSAETLLFKTNALATYMFEHDEQTVTKMYTLVNDIPDLAAEYKNALRNKIREKYPEYKFHTTEEKSSKQKGLIVTAAKLEEKKALVEKIQKVDMPANAKELNEARNKGDLKENAEYKAAKEQQHYLTTQLAKLQDELNRAVVFDPTTVSTATVQFGTKVTLLNKDTNENEQYTIMGPWESDPEKGTISYMSPRGIAMLDKKLDEDFDFTINSQAYKYKVLQIEVAK